MKQEVLEKLEHILGFSVDIARPRDDSFGHVAIVCFNLAKQLKKSPQLIASDIELRLKTSELFSDVSVVGGYVNIKLSTKFLDSLMQDALNKQIDFAKPKHIKKERILLEFVSANPTGPLHIGHARGAIYGNAILQIGRYLGHDIVSEYYINDAGRQIYLLGLSIYLRLKEAKNESVEFPDEYYRGEYINDLASKANSVFGDNILKDKDAITKLANWGKDEMLDEIKSNLAQFDISFDNFVSEKEIYLSWDRAKAILDSHNALCTKEDKVWLKTTLKDDEKDRVVIKDDGEPTYLAGDITYHMDKFNRNFDKYINIWGADHHGYIARVKAAIDFLGYDASKLEVILSQMVALLRGGEPYKMSKRAGNFILMKDVANDIGAEPLKFVFLSKKADTHLEFDVDELKKDDASNPIFYIQYAHARINSLLNRANKNTKDIQDTKIEDLEDSAKLLILDALMLEDVLVEAFNTKEMQRVTDYLKQLAARFHKFYNDNKIIGSDNEEVYLKIFLLVALSLKTALSLIGIQAKDKM